MEILQSWITIAINSLLTIIGIILFFHQRNVIKSKNETIGDLTIRNQELERVTKATSTLSDDRAKDLETFKGMFNLDFVKQYMEIHIKVEVDKVRTAAEQQAAHDRKMIDTMNDYLNEAISYIAFMLQVERKYTRDQRIKFFHTYFDKGKDMFWYITNQKIELIEKKKNQTQAAISDAPNTPDGTTQ